MSKVTVNSYCPEFGYELLSALPYAYNQYLKGNLQETISGFDTKCLYFFSPKHTETNTKRSWSNMKKLWEINFPNINIHRPELDWDLFSPPPLKEYYSDKSIKFEKETLVIFNRYNREWNHDPLNYLDLKTVESLFELLSDRYQIVYINIKGHKEYYDHEESLELGDEKILEKYPNVISLNDLMKMYPEFSVNELQVRIFSNCKKYISSNGGQLILSAYFGGENIIFSKKTRELNPEVNSFFKWYHKLGDGVFQHVNNYKDLIQLVKDKWIDNKPLINILVRTSHRPNYFKSCIESIYNQTYKNWNLIIGVDDNESLKYTQTAKGRTIQYRYSNYNIPNPPKNEKYGEKFIYNLYMNDLQNQVNQGYILYLDDDDILYSKDSLEKIATNIKGEDDLLFWKVKFPNRIVPSEKNFGKPPVVKDIDTVGFCFHHKYKQKWEPYKRGDYRIAEKLYDIIPNKKYINEVLTGLQRNQEGGKGKRDDIILTPPNLSVIIPTFNSVYFLKECLDSVLQSCKGINCEILVGIDACTQTLNYVTNNIFDSKIRFFYFEKNVGPYVIKNSLSKISNSEILLFFDSDDIMKETMVSEILRLQKNHEFVKPMYLDFDNDIKNINLKKNKSNSYGEGVFSIDKKLFLYLNGFEGWRCAADSDFMKRLYKNNKKFTYTNNVIFFRRKHKNNLTISPETSFNSKLRAEYARITKNKKTFEPLPKLIVEEFTEIYPKGSIYNYDYVNLNFEPKDPNTEKLELISKLTLKRQTLKPIIQEVRNTNERKEYITIDNTKTINDVINKRNSNVLTKSDDLNNSNITHQTNPKQTNNVQKKLIDQMRKNLNQSQQKIVPDGFKQKKSFNKANIKRRGGSFNF